MNKNLKIKEETINTNVLYTCESILNVNEYKKMVKCFPKRFYLIFAMYATFINLMFLTIITIVYKNLLEPVILFIIFQIFIMIYYKIRLEHITERVFLYRQKKGMINTNIKTEFYEDYFIRKEQISSLIIKYSDIVKFIETNTNFYLEYPQKKSIIIIQKDKCDSKLIDFIRSKFENLIKI